MPRGTEDAIEHGTFSEWPDGIRTLFDGYHIETKTGFTALLMAVDGHCVRTSMLSVGEVFAPDERSVLLALWPASRVAKAVEITGFVTMTFVFDQAYFQVQLEVKARPAAGPPNIYLATIQTGEWQRVDYARLKHGIEFEFAPEHEQATLARWRDQVASLRQAARP